MRSSPFSGCIIRLELSRSSVVRLILEGDKPSATFTQIMLLQDFLILPGILANTQTRSIQAAQFERAIRFRTFVESL